jgi:hypothetical protein
MAPEYRRGGERVSDGVIISITALVLVGVSGYLVWAMVDAIRRERRRSGIRRLWSNFGLSIAFCVLFLVSWAAQGFAEWGTYRSEQVLHGASPTIGGFLVAFGQSTLENWQSEFLQLFSFVVLSAVLIHRGSAESKDSDERMERTLQEIKERLDALTEEQARSRR